MQLLCIRSYMCFILYEIEFFYYLLFSDRYARLIRKKDVVDFNNRIAHINQYFKICIRISTTNNCINTGSKDVLRS